MCSSVKLVRRDLSDETVVARIIGAAARHARRCALSETGHLAAAFSSQKKADKDTPGAIADNTNADVQATRPAATRGVSGEIFFPGRH
jgi:hypothetical protein